MKEWTNERNVETETQRKAVLFPKLHGDLEAELY